MQWLRQQRKVESLSTAVRVNSGRMYRTRQQLVQQVHHRLQQPGSLAWAFAAGCLFGSTGTKEDATARRRAPNPGNLLRYLNGFAILLNLLSGARAGQVSDPEETQP